MTPLPTILDRLEKLEQSLDRKKWKAEGNDVVDPHAGGIIAECGGKPFWSDFPEVAEFIAEIRNATPALLRLVRAGEKLRECDCKSTQDEWDAAAEALEKSYGYH